MTTEESLALATGDTVRHNTTGLTAAIVVNHNGVIIAQQLYSVNASEWELVKKPRERKRAAKSSKPKTGPALPARATT